MKTLPYSGCEREAGNKQFDSSQSESGHRLLVVVSNIDRSIERIKERIYVDAFGISWPQAKLVMYLARYQTTKQVQIAGDLRYDEGALSRLLARLEHYGLVKRFPDSKDRRNRCISLTDRGSRLANELSATSRQLDGHLFSIFREDENSRLIRLLKRLICNGLDDAVSL
ncbi:MarR family winged helix-turn-helix transcriptional regulator [Paraburkholderia atlantica]|nr:MarR family winged helix-turn-helix transcriptional regulator [Paraburkholderia atlantica]